MKIDDAAVRALRADTGGRRRPAVTRAEFVRALLRTHELRVYIPERAAQRRKD